MPTSHIKESVHSKASSDHLGELSWSALAYGGKGTDQLNAAWRGGTRPVGVGLAAFGQLSVIGHFGDVVTLEEVTA